jgi:cytochrome P450
MIEEKTAQYLNLLQKAEGEPTEIFSSLHFFSIDAISAFVYGSKNGGTTALLGNPTHVALLDDILSPERRKLAWFAVHRPGFTKWAYAQTGLMSSILHKIGAIPMKAPTTYTGIREHALAACTSYLAEPRMLDSHLPQTVIERLQAYQLENPEKMSDLDIASECADHLLAGIDTTADTLLFLIWTLSLPQHSHIQEKLREELLAYLSSENGKLPAVKNVAALPFLSAVIKETLRLFAPIPATEPRLCRSDTVIDGYEIPAGTIVGMAPYTLHRDEAAYPRPQEFNPERWLDHNGKELGASERANKHFWAFSSGARMCIGSNLAMAEMVTLVAAMYGKYKTSVRNGEEQISPGVTSRFEVIWDETMKSVVEHECWIKFEKLD